MKIWIVLETRGETSAPGGIFAHARRAIAAQLLRLLIVLLLSLRLLLRRLDTETSAALFLAQCTELITLLRNERAPLRAA